MPGFFPCREICGCGRRKKHWGGPQRQSWPTEEPAAGLLVRWWLVWAVEQQRQLSGSDRGFLPSVSPVGRSLHLLFEELRQGGNLTAMTVRKLGLRPKSHETKKKFKANGGDNWSLQVRESPLRHVMFPTQGRTTGQAGVVQTNVEEE